MLKSIENFFDRMFLADYYHILDLKLLSVPSMPYDRLSYYEKRNVDPTVDLSAKDLKQIEIWMAKTVFTSADESTINLSKSDLRQIDSWMKKSESIPVDYEHKVSQPLTDAWNAICGQKYLLDLYAYEETIEEKKK